MATSTLSPGEVLGGYRIVSRLGRGGMSEVYLAEDPRLGRRVALKVLMRELSRDTASVKRFQREAKAASALNHPSILTIFELGEDRGMAFIAGEVIEGETLRQRIDRGSLPASEAIGIALQIASALAVAHDAAILHRDIKPENVMIRRDGLAKILDFGLAKLLSFDVDHRRASDRTTMPGTVIGTVHYMSPEQVRGERLDTRSDIFSFGAVLYEMLSSHAPFDGKTLSHVMAAVLESEPPPLSDRELQRIVSKAMRKDPGERYATMSQLAADLRNWAHADDVTIRVRRGCGPFAIALATVAAVSLVWLC